MQMVGGIGVSRALKQCNLIVSLNNRGAWITILGNRAIKLASRYRKAPLGLWPCLNNWAVCWTQACSQKGPRMTRKICKQAQDRALLSVQPHTQAPSSITLQAGHPFPPQTTCLASQAVLSFFEGKNWDFLD